MNSQIAVLLHVHSSKQLVLDTIESIQHYISNNILVIYDGFNKKEFQNMNGNFHKIEGFPKSIHRNICLGLQQLYNTFPEAKWFLYVEEDFLAMSSNFSNCLIKAEQSNVWLLANEGRIDQKTIPLLNQIFNDDLTSCSYKVLGCFMFFYKDLFVNLNKYNFFNKYIEETNYLEIDNSNIYKGYAISENIYPTIVRYFKKNIGILSTWDYNKEIWHGQGNYFTMRWKPEINIQENIQESIFLHPIKDFNNPIRELARKKRNGH